MSKALKVTFLIHAVVAALTGIPLLIIPGTFLSLIGWQAMLGAFAWENTDPFAARLLGAALLALAWSSFRGWRATDRAQAAILVEMEAVFTVAGTAGLLRHLLVPALIFGWWPVVGWITVAVLVIFAVAWIIFLVQGGRLEGATQS